MANDSNNDDSHDSAGKRLLEQAYQLETPTDNVAYYNELADSYDQDFAHGLGYVLPQAVAKIFLERVRENDSPVVDIGCGTGLLGKALHAAHLRIDGMDISDAMLIHSRNTGVYRDLMNVDLTGDIAKFNGIYGAVLSSGTFTHGHLGADVFVRTLNMAKARALFVVAVNQAHYASKGFDEMVQSLIERGQIVEFNSESVDIYQLTGHAHSGDKALILSFRKREEKS